MPSNDLNSSPSLPLRAYTKAFGRKILSLWEEEKASSRPRLCLRQKYAVPQDATDRELFMSLPTGDTWPDADMVRVWAYLYMNRKLAIPTSWQSTMNAFHAELLETAPGYQFSLRIRLG